MILAALQKLPKNVGDLGKLIVAKGFKKSPKVQKIANSGHTACQITFPFNNKLACFYNKIKRFVFQKQTIFLLNVEFIL